MSAAVDANGIVVGFANAEVCVRPGGARACVCATGSRTQGSGDYDAESAVSLAVPMLLCSKASSS